MEYKNFTGKMSSRDYLKYALFALLEEKNIYKITVRELCDKAMINRSTFYANYESLDVFFSSVMEDVASGLVAAVESEGRLQDMLRSKETACRRYAKWYDHVHDHADEFRLLLGPNGPVVFHDLLLEQGIRWYAQVLKPIIPKLSEKIPADIMTHYIVNAHLGLLTYYLDSGMKFSTKYMSEQMVNITMAGPYSLLGPYLD